MLVPSMGIEGAALASLIAYAGVFVGIALVSMRWARRGEEKAVATG